MLRAIEMTAEQVCVHQDSALLPYEYIEWPAYGVQDVKIGVVGIVHSPLWTYGRFCQALGGTAQMLTKRNLYYVMNVVVYIGVQGTGVLMIEKGNQNGPLTGTALTGTL